jgi:hypothetical protein
MSQQAARALAVLDGSGIIEQIGFEPWDESSTIHQLLNAGFPAEKTAEIRLTNRDKHHLEPVGKSA